MDGYGTGRVEMWGVVAVATMLALRGAAVTGPSGVPAKTQRDRTLLPGPLVAFVRGPLRFALRLSAWGVQSPRLQRPLTKKSVNQVTPFRTGREPNAPSDPCRGNRPFLPALPGLPMVNRGGLPTFPTP